MLPTEKAEGGGEESVAKMNPIGNATGSHASAIV
jgi:hypothetical protein